MGDYFWVTVPAGVDSAKNKNPVNSTTVTYTAINAMKRDKIIAFKDVLMEIEKVYKSAEKF